MKQSLFSNISAMVLLSLIFWLVIMGIANWLGWKLEPLLAAVVAMALEWLVFEK